MALSLSWPGKYYFYPIGNTSAVCLTRDVCPDKSTKILLLPCGDPRHVLYTIFCEPQNRKFALASDLTFAYWSSSIVMVQYAENWTSHVVISIPACWVRSRSSYLASDTPY